MILIAIGANLPSQAGGMVLDTCQAAVTALQTLPELKLAATSNWYRSAPIPRSPQPDYCNGVIRMEGTADPAQLLGWLHAIETRFGRTRPQPNAPRTLDLDLIDLNGLIRATPPPILPHPSAHLRAFVLRPILDVAPSWYHPTLKASVTTLLVNLPPQNIKPWFKG